MKINTHTFLLLPLLLLCAGCSSKEQAGAPVEGFGNAVRQNIAAQIVNPDAPERNVPPVYNGQRTALAQERYVTDKVEEPKTPKTSSSSAAGGGSGGGGGN